MINLGRLDTTSDIGIAKLESNNQPVLALLKYVEENLSEFVTENFKKKLDEDSYTENLCDILNQNVQTRPFWFHFQNKEEQHGKSASIDLAVKTRESVVIDAKTYSEKKRFFAIEAKILGVNDARREKEYLVGREIKDKEKIKYLDSGGVERFKKCIHAKELNYAAMIGYIVKEDSNYWFKNINNWVDDLIKEKIEWTKEDKLLPENNLNNFYSKYISKNSRYNNEKEVKAITLFHLWTRLN